MQSRNCSDAFARLDAGTLRIARALERTKAYGTRFKTPKSGKGRELAIDADLVALFRRERELMLRRIAGVNTDAEIDFSLLKPPANALVFWRPSTAEKETYDRPFNDADLSRNFRKVAKQLGYTNLRFHDLRGSHETALLEAGVPVHVVAARCGHSAQMLLKTYAERTHSADAKAALAVTAVFAASRKSS